MVWAFWNCCCSIWRTCTKACANMFASSGVCGLPALPLDPVPGVLPSFFATKSFSSFSSSPFAADPFCFLASFSNSLMVFFAIREDDVVLLSSESQSLSLSCFFVPSSSCNPRLADFKLLAACTMPPKLRSLLFFFVHFLSSDILE